MAERKGKDAAERKAQRDLDQAKRETQTNVRRAGKKIGNELEDIGEDVKAAARKLNRKS
jgi:F0F1-type ATP synthase membrane subunit b/b'